MDESTPETHEPKHHSHQSKPLVPILIGLVGGAALFFGVMAWYFTRVDPGGGAGGFKRHADKSSAADTVDGNFALETDVLEIVPLAEAHVKIVSGSAESVETPKDSGLTATLEGNSLKLSAAKDAKAGPHRVTVRDAKGGQATLTVSVKR